jgi:hypothetical protein
MGPGAANHFSGGSPFMAYQSDPPKKAPNGPPLDDLDDYPRDPQWDPHHIFHFIESLEERFDLSLDEWSARLLRRLPYIFEDRPADHFTLAPPGSEEKIKVLERRVKKRQRTDHHLDASYSPAIEAVRAADRPANGSTYVRGKS